MRRLALFLLLTAPAHSAHANGPDAPARVSYVVALDNDDDDDDGNVDSEQATGIVSEELRGIELPEDAIALSVDARYLRIVRDHRAMGDHVRLDGDARGVMLQGVRTTPLGAPTQVRVTRRSGEQNVSVTVVGASFLDARNQPIDPRRDALGLSHEVTNNATLPRNAHWDAQSAGDPDNVRIELWDPMLGDEKQATARVEVIDRATGTVRSALARVMLSRDDATKPLRSSFLRFVGDAMDLHAPGVADQVLRVSLRDRVRISYVRDGQTVTHDLSVGRPGDENGAQAARAGTLRIHVLRMQPRGAAVIGSNDAQALALGREQISIANDIWLQCFVSFGAPENALVQLEDPPPPTMISIGDEDGLSARGGGFITFRIGRQRIHVETRAGATPQQTAAEVARAVERAGFAARVFVNPTTEFGAGPSADVFVRDRQGAMVTITRDGQEPLSTDARQHADIGTVDLSDGITEFNNMNAATGTLEERTMLRSLSDADPSTVDIFIVNRFASGTRIGEAFVDGDGSTTVNALILDRNGLRAQRAAWTQSHELGHILLDHPFHPDNIGPDRPWLLMDADSSSALVTGPKRLTIDECHRLNAQSGLDTTPPLLRRFEPRASTPTPSADADAFPGYPR